MLPGIMVLRSDIHGSKGSETTLLGARHHRLYDRDFVCCNRRHFGDGHLTGVVDDDNCGADMSVIDLGPHERMTPEQVLAYAAREEWEHVVICGFHKDGETISVRSSHMTREFALWIVEHTKLHVMDRL